MAKERLGHGVVPALTAAAPAHRGPNRPNRQTHLSAHRRRLAWATEQATPVLATSPPTGVPSGWSQSRSANTWARSRSHVRAYDLDAGIEIRPVGRPHLYRAGAAGRSGHLRREGDGERTDRPMC